MKYPTLFGLISSVQTRRTVWFAPCTALIVLLSIGNIAIGGEGCNLFNLNGVKKGPACRHTEITENINDDNYYHNIPILTAVYCYNNGTGICKVLAGRFEFYMDSWKQTYLGPVKGDSEHEIDEHGYHRRVPVTYTIDGTVLYNDRAINWSRWFTKGNTQRKKLLSSESFNWCFYAPTNNWPYKSAILDHDGSTHIYFFNRQSCIYDPKKDEAMHYNTRFLHKSKLRIDLDYNPTIWAMQSNKSKEVHLVKHKRQHFKESTWKLKIEPRPGLKYFVKMDEVSDESAMIDKNGPFIRWQFYNRTDLCVSDHYGMRKMEHNAHLVPGRCGVDSVEIATHGKHSQEFHYEVGIHTIPRESKDAQIFYGINIEDDSEWEKFASDDLSFSATTIIPDNKTSNQWEVISLYSEYKGKASDDYDEHFPKTFLARYKVKYPWNVAWVHERRLATAKPHENLNYVDDIEYLPRCKTILVIFGPLYTEYPVDKFDVDTETLIGSIYALGANEMINAFFAKDDKLYFYHRLNFVAEHKYTCAKSADKLVTANPVEKYYFRYGTNSLPIFGRQLSGVTNHQEEKLFQDLGIFKGKLSNPVAPDADQFPYDPSGPLPKSKPLSWWVWVLILLGVLFLIAMFILGLMTYRRLRRRRYLARTQRSSLPSAANGVSRSTARSGGPKSDVVSAQPTQRSRMPSTVSRSASGKQRSGTSPGRSSSTKRSGMSSRSPAKASSTSSLSRLMASSSAAGRPGSSQP